MLIRFEVTNYRSIATPVELSMVAIDNDRVEARDQPMLGESLLPVAAIYGPNASGKSNLVAAFTWLRDAVENSLRNWEDSIPLEPFAFDNGTQKPSEFVLDLMVDGIRYEYVLELTSHEVQYEALFHYPEKKRRRIFERDRTELKLQRGLGSLSGTRELLTGRTLALSAARRFGEPLVSRFARVLLHTHVLGITQRKIRLPASTFPWELTGARFPWRETMQWFEESEQPSLFDDSETTESGLPIEDRERALALLRLADLGIDDVVIEQQADTPRTRARTQIKLLHKAAEERFPLDFAAESEGTRTWFQLIGPVLTVLNRGTLLLFDELDASLHPTLSAQLIKLFHNPATNPHGAQLIFTSHDTSLLNHLNRDEVWLTEKGPDGSTRLGALADFAGERVRKSQNLENAYLHGRFGALPEIDQTEFLRSLGLIG